MFLQRQGVPLSLSWVDELDYSSIQVTPTTTSNVFILSIYAYLAFDSFYNIDDEFWRIISFSLIV